MDLGIAEEVSEVFQEAQVASVDLAAAVQVEAEPVENGRQTNIILIKLFLICIL